MYKFELKLGLLISECTPTASHISLESRIVQNMFNKFSLKQAHRTEKTEVTNW
jgi:hypothetical protein